MNTIHVDIVQTPLSVDRAITFVDDAAFGATTVFIGKVRNHNAGRSVLGVSYDAFTPLAHQLLKELCLEAQEQWGRDLKIFIEHYCGRLAIGGLGVVIAVGSRHREEVYQASRYLIEQLKKRVPIWKQEHYVDGDSEWIHGSACCGTHSSIAPPT